MTSSANPSPLSLLEERSRDLAQSVRQRLRWFCVNPAEHALFLNTLSLMEHIGSRKIMASQSGLELSHETLKHLAEESRHAYFFKREAEKLARFALDYGATATIAGAFARGYMGRLDAEIAVALGPQVTSELPYLYMSAIVELRAIWLYRMYQAVLAEHQTHITLKSVLAEEELHLADMVARLLDLDDDATGRMEKFCVLEDNRFRAVWAAIESACGQLRVAAE